MVRALQRQAPFDDSSRRITFEGDKLQRKLSDLVTRSTIRFFIVLVVTEIFLPEDPTTGDANNACIQAQLAVRQLKFVSGAEVNRNVVLRSISHSMEYSLTKKNGSSSCYR